jgi:DNA-binding beta-propeller fold protein YncE
MGVNDLPNPSDRLDSWKEIAAFLGRTVRTVQRWEKTAGLPVRRGGPGRGAVVASKLELADWWQRRRDTLSADDDVGPDDVCSGDELPAEPAATPSAQPRGGRRARAWPVIAILLVTAVSGLVALILWRTRPAEPVSTVPRIVRAFASASSEGQAVTLAPISGTLTDMEIAPDDSRLYLAFPRDRAVAVIGTATLRLERRITTVEAGSTLALSPDGKRLYVGGLSDVGVIDLERDTIDRIPIGSRVYDLQASPDGRSLWVALAQGGLKRIDTTSRDVTVWSTVGCPAGLTMDAAGRRLYVAYQCGGPGGRSGHDAIEILDAVTGRSVITQSGPPLVGGRLTLSPDGNYVWADAHDACVSPQYDHLGCPPGSGAVLHILRTSTLDSIASVLVPGAFFGAPLAFFPDGSRVVASAMGLHVVHAALGHVEERLALGTTGQPVFAHDGSRLFVSVDDTKMLAMLPIDATADARDLSGLRTYWTGDGTANDAVGGTHAEVPIGVRFAPGRFGQAFWFDGTAGVSFGRYLDVDPVDGPVTIAAWIKTDHPGAMSLVTRGSLAGWQWSLTAEGRAAYCLVSGLPRLGCDQMRFVGRRPVTPGLWRHVAVVKSDDRLVLYQDGQVDAETGLDGYRPPPSGKYDVEPILRLGTGPGQTSRFSGLIDEVTLFKRALTAEEIARLMDLTTITRR